MTKPPSGGAVVEALARHVPDGSAPAAELLQPARERVAAAWPAEVLARCVVLRAHERGGPRALRPLGTPAVVSLWQRALDDVLDLSGEHLTTWLSASRAVVVRCGPSPHRLVLDGSRLLAPSHAAVDHDLEQVAAALGGEVPACLHAQQHWPAPGPPRGPVAALAWLHLVRAWIEHGYGPARSAVAVDELVFPATVLTHLTAGLGLADAVTWRRLPAVEAVRWIAVGASHRQAAAWTARGRSLVDLDAGVRRLGRRRVARRAAVRLLLAWVDAVPALDLDTVVAWIGPGREASTWGEVAARGVTPAQAASWQRHGFGPVEVLRYHHLRVPVATARAWRDAGVCAKDAAQHIADGTPLSVVVPSGPGGGADPGLTTPAVATGRAVA